MYKRGATGDAIRPKFSILNPELTETLPAYQTAAGITDIMAHLYERYLTNSREVEITDRMIEIILLMRQVISVTSPCVTTARWSLILRSGFCTLIIAPNSCTIGYIQQLLVFFSSFFHKFQQHCHQNQRQSARSIGQRSASACTGQSKPCFVMDRQGVVFRCINRIVIVIK